MIRVNIGCGQTPTKNWRNFDNSPSIRISKVPLLPTLLFKVGILNTSQYKFVQYARVNSIEYGNAIKGLPIATNSADVIYSSHMLEHLDKAEAELFLREARRLLRSGGIIRISVPDIRKQIQQYLVSNDADAFIGATRLTQLRPTTLAGRIRVLLCRSQDHRWMYDGASLSGLLRAQGFRAPVILPAGQSMIENPEDLDLHEQAAESVYVEATNP